MIEQKKTFQKVMKIGEGAYGSVYKAIDTQSKQVVALKITRFDLDDEGVPSTTMRQISILKNLKHPNILKLKDIIQEVDKDQYVIQLVFQYMDEDLSKFIKRRKQEIVQPEYKYIFKKIVEGVRYMHEKKIYHRDLKPQNILINSLNEVKIADFGLSRVILNPNRTFSKQIQTLWYRSPQLLLGVRHYGENVDMWSLGCILYELAQGKVLFRGDSQISQIFTIFGILGTPKISDWPQVRFLPYFKKTFPKMIKTQIKCNKLSEVGLDLLYKLIQINPKKRINIGEVLKHSFLTQD